MDFRTFRRLVGIGLVGLWLGGPALSVDLDGYAPPRGEGSVALSFTSESWDEFWRGETRVRNPGVGSADIVSWTLWGRYGLTDRWTLIGTLPYVDAESDGTMGFAQSSVQDLTVVAQYRFFEGPLGSGTQSWSAAFGGRFPVGDYDANLPIDVGDGTTDVLTRLVFRWQGRRAYVSQQLGFDLRSEDAPDQLPLYTEVGVTTGQLTWSGMFQWLLADGGTDIGDPGFTFPSNQEEYQRVGLKLYARLSDRWGLSAGGFTAVDGRNTADTTGFFLGGVVRIGR